MPYLFQYKELADIDFTETAIALIEKIEEDPQNTDPIRVYADYLEQQDNSASAVLRHISRMQVADLGVIFNWEQESGNAIRKLQSTLYREWATEHGIVRDTQPNIAKEFEKIEASLRSDSNTDALLSLIKMENAKTEPTIAAIEETRFLLLEAFPVLYGRLCFYDKAAAAAANISGPRKYAVDLAKKMGISLMDTNSATHHIVGRFCNFVKTDAQTRLGGKVSFLGQNPDGTNNISAEPQSDVATFRGQLWVNFYGT